MRRHLQQISELECEKILNEQDTGVLSIIDDNGYPYLVPLNYVYYEKKIYFHCAMQGEKIDCIKQNNQVGFCVIEKDEVMPEALATNYGSVTIRAQAKIINDENTKKDVLMKLCEKYAKEFLELAKKEISTSLQRTCIVELNIINMTGKFSKNRLI